MSNKTSPRKGHYFTSDLELPKISNNKITLSRNLPKDRALVRQLTSIGALTSGNNDKPMKRQYTSYGEFPRIKQPTNVCFFPNRKAEKDKKWSLQGWDADYKADDGKLTEKVGKNQKGYAGTRRLNFKKWVVGKGQRRV